MQIVLEISRDTTFTTVNLPIGTISWKVSVIFQFILTSHLGAIPSRCNLMAFLSTIFEDKNLNFPPFDFAIFFTIS
jgi:hypothetical protein